VRLHTAHATGWDKRFEFAELKRKFPSLGTQEDEELLLDKERVAKKPKIVSQV
jgi:enhancer of polycomb-like protein